MLRTILVAVPALRRVEPAMISGPTAGRDGEIDERLQLVARIAGHEHDPRAGLAGAGQRAADEWRHAAGRHADHHILLRRIEAGDGARAFFVIVFRAFFGADDGLGAAGHDALHQLGIGAEGRGHLGGLDNAEAARGAGADEDDPAALAERLRAHVGAKRDAVAFLLNRRDHAAVFGEHQIHNAAGVELVDVEGIGIDGFSREGLPSRTGCCHYRVSSPNPEKLMLVLVLPAVNVAWARL